VSEGKRQAASMKVAISNYVASAALAVIGGAAALYTYISQTFEPPRAFWVLMVLGLACLVGSIVAGGLGADDATVAVADDTWTMNTSGGKFNGQAILTLVGLILVILATLIGASSDRRESSVEDRLEKIEQQIEKEGSRP
jgi:predicted MFS family arabinose efflux permease